MKVCALADDYLVNYNYSRFQIYMANKTKKVMLEVKVNVPGPSPSICFVCEYQLRGGTQGNRFRNMKNYIFKISGQVAQMRF